MTASFLDSSAFSKLFLVENGSLELRQFLRQIGNSRVAVCSIAKLEVCSALQRRMFLREISVLERDRGIAHLEETLDQVVVTPVDAGVLDTAASLITSHRLRSLDALQLAAALLLREEIGPGNSLLFVASDRRLLDAAAVERLDTWNPDDRTAPPVN